MPAESIRSIKASFDVYITFFVLPTLCTLTFIPHPKFQKRGIKWFVSIKEGHRWVPYNAKGRVRGGGHSKRVHMKNGRTDGNLFLQYINQFQSIKAHYRGVHAVLEGGGT